MKRFECLHSDLRLFILFQGQLAEYSEGEGRPYSEHPASEAGGCVSGFLHIHNLLSNAPANKLKHNRFLLLPCSPTGRQPL